MLKKVLSYTLNTWFMSYSNQHYIFNNRIYFEFLLVFKKNIKNYLVVFNIYKANFMLKLKRSRRMEQNSYQWSLSICLNFDHRLKMIKPVFYYNKRLFLFVHAGCRHCLKAKLQVEIIYFRVKQRIFK